LPEKIRAVNKKVGYNAAEKIWKVAQTLGFDRYADHGRKHFARTVSGHRLVFSGKGSRMFRQAEKYIAG
jgi:hypothetical protein